MQSLRQFYGYCVVIFLANLRTVRISLHARMPPLSLVSHDNGALSDGCRRRWRQRRRQTEQ